MASGGDITARARELCLEALERCADACEAALEAGESGEARRDLVVSAAVCRVAHRALGDALVVAETLVQYAVEVCRTCAHALRDADGDRLEDAALACTAAAEAAAMLLLVS